MPQNPHLISELSHLKPINPNPFLYTKHYNQARMLQITPETHPQGLTREPNCTSIFILLFLALHLNLKKDGNADISRTTNTTVVRGLPLDLAHLARHLHTKNAPSTPLSSPQLLFKPTRKPLSTLWNRYSRELTHGPVT